VKKRLTIFSLVAIVLLGVMIVRSASFREHRARAFAYAAAEGAVWKMKLLRLAGADPGEEAPGTTRALIGSACYGKLNAAQYLLESGVDINQRDKWGQTPLICAAHQGQVAMIRYLLARGADVNIVGEEGSPLHEALQAHHVEAAQLLKDHGALDLDGTVITPRQVQQTQ
jgi:ankyrin repeat protein